MAVAENAVNSDEQYGEKETMIQPQQQQEQLNHLQSSANDQAEFKKGVQNLVELFTKLNPSAKEFFPSSYVDRRYLSYNGFMDSRYLSYNGFIDNRKESSNGIVIDNRRRRNGFNQNRRRLNGKTPRAQREDSVRRTVYVSDIHQDVTEEQLAGLFLNCGEVGDCRICGDPNSVLRFAFVEFSDEKAARMALSFGGTLLGQNVLKVLPSKTAILPVNPSFLPRSEDEREMCTRTVYCTNIDKKVSEADLKNFFEHQCGEVSRLRLLGDHVHSTRIAFVEFVLAESAISALAHSGLILGTLRIRVSPSKTPVRPRMQPPSRQLANAC